MKSPDQVLAKLRTACLAFPETSEKSSWGHPNFRAGKKTFAAFERVKGRPSIAFRLERDTVERLLSRKPFFTTPYGRGLWVSIWADTRLDWRMVGDLLERSYRVVALRRMISELEKARP
jgi:predicted DNA-binding protein (MmcQ/YjbR family)